MDPQSIKRIVVATDFSDLSREAIDTAVGLARQFGATIDLVHVAAELALAAPPPMDVVTLPVNPGAVVADASRRMADEEGRVRERGIACESSVLMGRSDAEIVAHADATHSDLIVIATHGRTGLGHALLGSVAEKVVQHAHCPVLTVPERRSPQA